MGKTDKSNNQNDPSTDKSYRTSGRRLKTIYDKKVYPEYNQDTFSTVSPRFIIVCAQPGAGKSRVSNRLRAALTEAFARAVHNDVDDMRRFHPRLNEILAEDPMKMGTHTHEDVSVWKGWLLDDSRVSRKNVVLEISLKTADNTKREIERFQREGYEVELHAMAVNENISRLGIFQRFERAIISSTDAPRYVPLDLHDDGYHALPRNVDDIEQNCDLDLVTVNNRAGDIIYERKNQAGRAQAMEAILLERNRAWIAGETKEYFDSWKKVIKAIQARPDGALKPAFYLSDLQKAVRQAYGGSHIVIGQAAVEQDLYPVIGNTFLPKAKL